MSLSLGDDVGCGIAGGVARSPFQPVVSQFPTFLAGFSSLALRR